MKVLENPQIEILDCPDPQDAYLLVEEVARTCYASHDKTGDGSAEKLIKSLIESKHNAMLEFFPDITARFTTTRPVSHELVRHRLASYAERSQRYCNFTQHRFDSSVMFLPPMRAKKDSKVYEIWEEACRVSEQSYRDMLAKNIPAEDARTVLNNSVVTVIVMKTNVRHLIESVLELRTSSSAWTEMRRMMIPFFLWLNETYPLIFNPLYETRKEEIAKFLKEYGLSTALINDGSEFPIRYITQPKLVIQKIMVKR